MKSSILRTAPLLAIATFGSACVVSVDSQGQIVREEKRFTVTGTPEVHLTTFDGSIEIQAWDKAEVAIDIEKRGATREVVDGLEVKSSQTGNRIELEVKRPRAESFSGLGFHQSASARLIVSAPKDVNVVAKSGDGSITIERVNGRLELRTGDGSIRASDVSGELILDTGDGSVTVDGAQGRLEVDTGDGGVNVTGRLTSVKLHTGDGSIVYRAEPGTEMSDNWEITTGDGGVTLYLPSGFGAELDAHTGDGSIRNDLDVAGQVESNNDEDKEESRRTLRGRLGAGGKQIRVRTGDGTIRLRPS
jgi:DUF4097 and DUF4098 domain-containing protein YvlB